MLMIVPLTDEPWTYTDHLTPPEHPELDCRNPDADNYFHFPSDSTIRRLIQRRGTRRHIDQPAGRRRTSNRIPSTANHPTHPGRPGGEGIADVTRMDIECLDKRGNKIRPCLVLVIDKHTRDFPTWVITEGDPNGTDLAIALAEGVVPIPLRDGGPERYQLVNSRLPVKTMIALDARYEHALARPCIPLEALVLDNGSDFRSNVLDDITTALGTSLRWCNGFSPWEKGVVERAFRTVHTLFDSYFHTYVGTDPQHRGDFKKKTTLLGIDTVRELFEEWVLTVYRYRPHEALADPEQPSRKLSPNDMWTASMAYAPRCPIPLTDRMLYRAYPVRWQTIQDYGVQVDHHRYDCDDLDDLRQEQSGIAAHHNKWETRYNPHNRSCVWIHHPRTDQWITAYVTRYDEINDPFSDQIWAPSDLPAENIPTLAQAADDLRRRSAQSSTLIARTASIAADRRRRIEETPIPLPQAAEPEDDDHADDPDENQPPEPQEPGDGTSPKNFTPWSV